MCVCECVCVRAFPWPSAHVVYPGSSSSRLGGDPPKEPAEAPCTRTRTLKAGDLKMDLHAHRGLRSIATNIYGLDC